MGIVGIKCPNCGGQLEFNKYENKFICKYCNGLSKKVILKNSNELTTLMEFECEIYDAIKKNDVYRIMELIDLIKKLDKNNFYCYYMKSFQAYYDPDERACLGKPCFFEDFDLVSFNASFIDNIQGCIRFVDSDQKLELFLNLYLLPIYTISMSKARMGIYIESYNDLSLPLINSRESSYYNYLLKILPKYLLKLKLLLKTIRVNKEKLKVILFDNLKKFMLLINKPENVHLKNGFAFVTKILRERIKEN